MLQVKKHSGLNHYNYFNCTDTGYGNTRFSANHLYCATACACDGILHKQNVYCI